MAATDRAIDIAVDNDLVLKAVCYGITSDFWPGLGTTHEVGVLGAARYVVSKRLERTSLAHDQSTAQAELTSLLTSATELEPTDREVSLAAELEVAAQQEGLSLDSGESQLAAMVIERAVPILETGDKRAIRSIEQLLDKVVALLPIQGRVRCLEQIVWRVLDDDGAFDRVAGAICAEPGVDKTLSICFACSSGRPPALDQVVEGLASYIASLRADAPRVLVREPS